MALVAPAGVMTMTRERRHADERMARGRRQNDYEGR
jgi:hypothetical protein